MTDSMVFYESFYRGIDDIAERDQLNLYKAIFNYAFYDIEPELDGPARGFFAVIKPQIDANVRRRMNGARGGRPSKTYGLDNKKPMVSDNENRRLKNEKANGNVNVNVNDNEENTSPCESALETLFSELWALYPRKMGKGSVSKSTKQKLLKIGREKMISAIERFKADMERQNRPLDKYPYGSTFFNSGYLDYLDGPEVKETPPEEPKDERVDWSNPYVYRDRIAEGYTVENGRWIPPVRVQ